MTDKTETNTAKETGTASKSELSDLLCPIKSISMVINFSPKDWSLTKDDAWLYGIVVGWDNDSLLELKEKLNWSEDNIIRLKKLHENFRKLRTMT